VRGTTWLGGILAVVAVAVSVIAVAAQGGGKPATGNPTPGTPQPEPPKLADRVTLTGCVKPAATNGGQGGADAADPNTPSNSRFVLTGAARQDIVPTGTGGSPLAGNTASRQYRLEAIDSQVSPFVGTKVEISGEIKAPAPGSSQDPPTLLVEFVQKISATCP
jgi:hypothetical protein